MKPKARLVKSVSKMKYIGKSFWYKFDQKWIKSKAAKGV